MGDDVQVSADVDAARVQALIRRGLLVPCEPAQHRPDSAAFQQYDLSRTGLAQLPDDGSYPTLHDRLFGTRLTERYALELAACAGNGYALQDGEQCSSCVRRDHVLLTRRMCS